MKPLFSFWEPWASEGYISKKAVPGGSRAAKEYGKNPATKQARNIEPNETFDDFFKEYYENTSSLKQEEK